MITSSNVARELKAAGLAAGEDEVQEITRRWQDQQPAIERLRVLAARLCEVHDASTEESAADRATASAAVERSKRGSA